MSNPDDGSGDTPDTFEGRLAGITRLIDTLGNETDTERRRQRRATILRLLDRLSDRAHELITEQRGRLR